MMVIGKPIRRMAKENKQKLMKAIITVLGRMTREKAKECCIKKMERSMMESFTKINMKAKEISLFLLACTMSVSSKMAFNMGKVKWSTQAKTKVTNTTVTGNKERDTVKENTSGKMVPFMKVTG